jgi:uncharacterized protein YqgV (UPF0045/DUF77 family)
VARDQGIPLLSYKQFDRIYNSYYLGKRKRDTSLFSEVAADLCLPPSAILFFDDNGENVARATPTSIQAIQYVDDEFSVETHASGTNIEGELAEILAAVRHVHEALHQEGSIRLLSYLKLETRTDKVPTLAGKRL